MYKRQPLGVDHGNLALSAVELDNLVAGLVARLLPDTATDGQTVRYNATDSEWEAVAEKAGISVGPLPTVLTDYPLGALRLVEHDDIYVVKDSSSGTTATRILTGLTVTTDRSGTSSVTIPITGGDAVLETSTGVFAIRGPSTLGVGNSFLVTIGNNQYTFYDGGNVPTDAEFIYYCQVGQTFKAFNRTSDLNNAVIQSHEGAIFTGVTAKHWSPTGIGGDLIRRANAPLRITQDRTICLLYTSPSPRD